MITTNSTRRALAIFLALSLILPSPACALRDQEVIEKKPEVLSGLEEALRNPDLFVQIAGTTLGLPSSSATPATALPAAISARPAAGMEEKGADAFIDAFRDLLIRMAKGLDWSVQHGGVLELETKEEMAELAALKQRFQEEIEPLQGRPEAFFDYVARHDNPPSSFQNEVRNTIAQRIGIPARQIVFLRPEDPFPWMLLQFYDFIEERPKGGGVDIRIAGRSGNLTHLLIISANPDDMSGLQIIAHEGAHVRQSLRILRRYSNPLVRAIVEGFQAYAEKETILWLANQGTPLAESVRRIVQQAFHKHSSSNERAMRKLLRAILSPGTALRESAGGTATFSEQLTELLTRSAFASYRDEQLLVNRLIDRTGETAVRQFYEDGNIHGLRQAAGLGPTRFDGLRAFLRKWEQTRLARLLERQGQIIGLHLAASLILDPPTYSRADTRRMLRFINVLSHERIRHEEKFRDWIRENEPEVVAEVLVPLVQQYMRKEMNDKQALDKIAALYAAGMEESIEEVFQRVEQRFSGNPQIMETIKDWRTYLQRVPDDLKQEVERWPTLINRKRQLLQLLDDSHAPEFLVSNEAGIVLRELDRITVKIPQSALVPGTSIRALWPDPPSDKSADLAFIAEALRLLREFSQSHYQSVETYVRLIQIGYETSDSVKGLAAYVNKTEPGLIRLDWPLTPYLDRESRIRDLSGTLAQEADHLRFVAQWGENTLVADELIKFEASQRSLLTDLLWPYDYLLEVDGHFATIESLLDVLAPLPYSFGRSAKLLYIKRALDAINETLAHLKSLDEEVLTEEGKNLVLQQGKRMESLYRRYETMAGMSELERFDSVDAFLDKHRTQLQEQNLLDAVEVFRGTNHIFAFPDVLRVESVIAYPRGVAPEWASVVEGRLKSDFVMTAPYPENHQVQPRSVVIQQEGMDVAKPSPAVPVLIFRSLEELRQRLTPGFVYAIAVNKNLAGQVIGPIVGILTFTDEQGRTIHAVFA